MADEREYFERLVAVLREHGFEWVVEQAQAEIAQGRSVTKEVRAPDVQPIYYADTLVRQAPRRRRAELIATVPFGAAEQLHILLHAIEAAIIDRAALEEAVLKGVGDNIDIEFLPEVSEGAPGATLEPRAHRLDRGRLGGGQSIRLNLSEALMRLRELTNAGRSRVLHRVHDHRGFRRDLGVLLLKPVELAGNGAVDPSLSARNEADPSSC